MAADVTSRSLARTWRSAEGKAMAGLGGRRSRTDGYDFVLDEAGDWLGWIYLPKKPVPPPETVVELSPISFSIAYLPVEQIIHELKDPAREVGVPVTRLVRRWDVFPEEVDRRIENLIVTNDSEIADAVFLATSATREHILPWMNDNADIEQLVAYLETPSKNPSEEPDRLEKLAALKFRLGALDDSLSALSEYEERYCSTGIEVIDMPGLRYVDQLRNRIAG